MLVNCLSLLKSYDVKAIIAVNKIGFDRPEVEEENKFWNSD